MSDTIFYEQAFYGSGIEGYQVLKNSAPQYNSVIEKICGAIGTPDGFSKISAFLINYLHGDMIFMGRCIPGPPDRYNRKTLFFHIIYGNIQKNIDGNMNAFTLLRNNVFIDRVPEQCSQIAVAKSEKLNFTNESPFIWRKTPLAIQCNSPQNELIEQLLGKDANDYSWASFSFAPLPNFRLYAISEYSSTPVNIDCCDVKGNIIQNKEQFKKKVESEKQQEKTVVEKHKKRNLLLSLFIASLLVNAFLIYQNISLNSKAVEKEIIKEVVKEVPGPVQIKTVEKVVQLPPKPVDMKKLKRDVIADLKRIFPSQYRIKDWNKELSRNENNMLRERFEDANSPQYFFLKQCQIYVDFVNNNILTQLNEGE